MAPGLGLLWVAICLMRVAGDCVAYSLDRYPHARCLDGSPGRYYHRSGTGDGRTKFLLFFEGGGFCTSHDDCAARARSYFGSTSADPPSRRFGHSFLTDDIDANPLMWNWNAIEVRYCDGGYFSGSRVEPASLAGAGIFYSGRFVLEALIEDLVARHALGNATDVVVSGCSAGAIHTIAHLDAVRGMLPPQARVVGLADSGFYLDAPMFTPLKRFVIDAQDGRMLLSPACLEDHRGAEEKCLVASVNWRYVASPLFLWQSRYDTDQRSCEMSQTCARSEACVRRWGDRLSEEVARMLEEKPLAATFLDSCSRHCEGPAAPLDDRSGQTPLQAFASWYLGGATRAFGQTAPFPCGGCCSGGGAGDEWP